jgi:uncharacterized protein YicC (UPF0701 family)
MPAARFTRKGLSPAALVEMLNQKRSQRAKQGKTVEEIIVERIKWMQTPVRQADDPEGEMRPRIESWSNVASHLRRFLSARLGKKVVSEATKHDIAAGIYRKAVWDSIGTSAKYGQTLG